MNPRSKMLAELLKGVLDVPPQENREIVAITFDSRQVVPGGMFIARNGIATHGLAFAKQALERGATAILWESVENLSPPEFPPEVFTTALDDFAITAGEITAEFYDRPSESMKVIGITGTNGKTTVSQLVAQALENAGHDCGLIGTLGIGRYGKLQQSDLTTPDVVRVQQQFSEFEAEGCSHVSMEVSSHALDQGRVCGVRFHTAVFTNLTRDHLDYHSDERAYAVAKSKLFAMEGLACVVINAEDPVGQDLARCCAEIDTVITYGMDGFELTAETNSHVLVAREVQYLEQGLSFVATCGGERASVAVPLVGRFNVYNILAVIGVLLGQGFSLRSASESLQNLQQIKGRMERFGGNDRPLVIVDYAHTPDALLQALAAARAHTQGQLVCVFGCGGDRDRGKRSEMGRIAERLADRVLVTDDNPRTEKAVDIVCEILAGFEYPNNVNVIHDRARAIAEAIRTAKIGDVVLVAGKGHEEYQITGDDRQVFSDSDEVTKSLGGQAA